MPQPLHVWVVPLDSPLLEGSQGCSVLWSPRGATAPWHVGNRVPPAAATCIHVVACGEKVTMSPSVC